jgi:hypothetical protein
MGLIPPEHLDGPRSLNNGWTYILSKIRERAERSSAGAKK